MTEYLCYKKKYRKFLQWDEDQKIFYLIPKNDILHQLYTNFGFSPPEVVHTPPPKRTWSSCPVRVSHSVCEAGVGAALACPERCVSAAPRVSSAVPGIRASAGGKMMGMPFTGRGAPKPSSVNSLSPWCARNSLGTATHGSLVHNDRWARATARVLDGRQGD